MVFLVPPISEGLLSWPKLTNTQIYYTGFSLIRYCEVGTVTTYKTYERSAGICGTAENIE